MRLTAEQALSGFYEDVRVSTVPKTIGIKIEKPIRDASIGAAAGVFALLFIIGLGLEIEIPENAPLIIGAEAYAQLYSTEPPKPRTEQTRGETWKTKPA